MNRLFSKAGTWVVAVIAMIGLGAVAYNMVKDNLPKGERRTVEGYTPWSKETLEIAATLPVQNEGRVKPLISYAGFTMLGMHGARSMKIEDEKGNEHKLKPTAWMLDALFRPALAVKLPTFRIDNSDVLTAIGVESRGRRDRYSYNDIEPGRQKLIELAKSYENIEKAKRDPIQQQTIDLAYNLRNYESLLGYFGFARTGVVLRGSGPEGPSTDQRVDISSVMLGSGEIRKVIADADRDGKQLPAHLIGMLDQVLDGANFSKYGLFILPPKDVHQPVWQSAGNVIMDVMTAASPDPETSIKDVAMLEETAKAATGDEAAFRAKLATLRDEIQKRAEARGESKRTAMEASYYQKDWFLYALVWFLIATLTGLTMWAVSGKTGTVLQWATILFTLAGVAYCVIAIVKRCLIMGRPPVGNLYDTIIFIGPAIVLIALIVEWMTRRRFALGLAPILGVLLIVLARRYELGDAKDHMTPLVAVLDSNYWLTTHVITITLGYAAGLLAAFLSCGYVLMRGLNLDDNDRDLRRSFTRATYGIICLCLFLSLVGTVLGGIWANDSWGRFWGWDPKENGALMIVIWTLAILHARVGGYIKEWGLHLASIFTACIVSFSWWHVNFLGVGLHNYGFTSSTRTIWTFYGVMMLFLLFGAVCWIIDAARKSTGTPQPEGNLAGSHPSPESSQPLA